MVDSVTIAYIYERFVFQLDETQSIKEFPVLPMDGRSYIAWDWEIIKPFININNLTPIWIDCNSTLGVFDEDTGTWTGAVGMVRNFKQAPQTTWL